MENNGFWENGWGPRPADELERERVVRLRARRLPRLFPVFAHRGLVIDPVDDRENADGNPVFSVVQTDVIYYGFDLAGWFNIEFGVPLPAWAAREPRRVPFWSELTDPGRWAEPTT